MDSKFSKAWRGSKQPRKQRKFVAEAPLHIKKDQLSVHLSPALRKDYGKRSVLVRKGDKVKILRGNYKGKEGKIDKVSYRDCFVHVTNITYPKNDGSNSFYPLDPSNLMITELDLSDNRRKKSLERK